MKLVRTPIATALLAQFLLAQAPPILDTPLYDIVDAFPYLASKAVASDPATNEIYDGAGGGVIRLAHTPGSLALVSSSPQRFDTGGMTMDLALTSDFAYIAASGRGLQVRQRSNVANQASFVVAGRAWRVATLDVGDGHRLVFVGTHEPDPTELRMKGALHVFDHDTTLPLAETGAAQNPKPLGTPFALGAPTWAIAASNAIPFQVPFGSVPVCVLVGVESGSCLTSAPPPLRRLNYHYTASSSSPLVAMGTTSWQGDASVTPTAGGFVRDCVIDGAHDRAYVATYWDGVYAFELQSGLAQSSAPGWPIKHGTPPQVELAYANALALDVAPADGAVARLVVGRGWSLPTESQYIGDCMDQPCNLDAAPPEAQSSAKPKHYGVASYAIGANGSPTLEAMREAVDPAPGQRKLTCEQLALRPGGDAGTYYIDVASDTLGFHVLCAQRDTQGAWSIVPDAEWSTEPVARVPLHAMDDAVVVDHGSEGRALYVATELGVTAFDLAGTTPMSQADPALAKQGAIVLAAFANPNGRIIAGTAGGREQPGGVRFYSSTTPLSPTVAGSHELQRGGYGYGIATHAGFAPGERFIYTVSGIALSSPPEWAVRCWSIGTQFNASQFDPNTAPQLCSSHGQYFVCDPCSSAGQEPVCLDRFRTASHPATADSKLDAIAVVDQAPGVQVVYVLYSPRSGSTSTEAGLLVLQLTNASSTPVLQFVTTAAVWNDADSHFESARISVDGNRLYAAWATGGIAFFEISNKLAPVLRGAFALNGPTGSGLRSSTTHAVPGPLNASNDRYVFVSHLNDGIAIYKWRRSDNQVLLVHDPIPMRFQAITLVRVPGDPRSIYVCGGRAGIDKVTFDPSLFP